MPTLRTIIDGRDLTLGDMMPRVKAAAKPIVNPADDEEDDDSSDDTATHIAKHIQDPVGSTKQMFQDLTEKKLAFDMQKAIAKQGLAPVKAIIDHVEQTYELNGPNLITGNPGMNPDQQGGFTPNGPGAPQINRPNNGGQMNNMQPGEDDARPNNQTQPPAAKARTQMRSPMPKTRSEDEKQVPPRQVNVNKGKRNTRGGFSVHIKSSTAPLPRGIQQMQSAVALQGGGPGSGRHPEGGSKKLDTSYGKTLQNRGFSKNARGNYTHPSGNMVRIDYPHWEHHDPQGNVTKGHTAIGLGEHLDQRLGRVKSSAIEAGGKGSGRYKTTYSGTRHVGGRVRKHEQRRVEENEKGLRAGGPGSGRKSEGGSWKHPSIGVNRDYKTSERRAFKNLAKHNARMQELMEQGMDRNAASTQAFKELFEKKGKENLKAGGPGSGRRPGIGTNAKTYAEHKSASENHLYRARTLDEQGEKDAANAHYRASDAHHDAAKSVDTEGDVDKTSSRNARKLSNKAYIADQERFISLGGKDK